MELNTLVKLLSNPEGLRKLVATEWSFPPLEKILPGYFSFLAGFAAAAAVTIAAAAMLLNMVSPERKPIGEKTASLEPPVSSLQMPMNPVLNDFSDISGRNLFNSEGTLAEGGGGERVCEFKKTQLPLRFTGIIFGGSSETSLVVVESNATKQAETFMLNDLLPGDALIVEIQKERIVLEKSGCREFLDLEAPPPPKRRIAGTKSSRGDTKGTGNSGEGFREDGFERRGNNTKVERRWIDRALGPDFAKTLQDAKASPNLVGNEIKGFVLSKIRPDSAYEKMGLLDGDIVENINGIDLNGMAQAVQTLNAMRNESSISIGVRRGGQPMTFTVEIPR